MRSTQGHRWLGVGVSVGIIVLTGVTMAGLHALRGRDKDCPDCGSWKESPLKARYQAAKTLLRENRFREAGDAFLAIKQADASFETVQLNRYLDVIHREIPNQVALRSAREAISAGRFDDARASLQKVSAPTMMDAEVARLTATLNSNQRAP